MPHAPRTELSRDLGLFTITMGGVRAVIGPGIFVLTGIAAGTTGPALILAFPGNGLVTFLTALAYAELGPVIPEASGGRSGRRAAAPPLPPADQSIPYFSRR